MKLLSLIEAQVFEFVPDRVSLCDVRNKLQRDRRVVIAVETSESQLSVRIYEKILIGKHKIIRVIALPVGRETKNRILQTSVNALILPTIAILYNRRKAYFGGIKHGAVIQLGQLVVIIGNEIHAASYRMPACFVKRSCPRHIDGSNVYLSSNHPAIPDRSNPQAGLIRYFVRVDPPMEAEPVFNLCAAESHPQIIVVLELQTAEHHLMRVPDLRIERMNG